jgi:C1A family cysteine protease
MQKYQAQMASVGSNSGKTKLIAYAKKILDKHGTLTKDVWTQEKLESGIASFPKFENIINYFENIDALKEAASCYNHKITKIEYVNETMDVYCLEVPQYHNFALAAGVFVHNCTAHAVAGVIEYNDKRFNSKPVNKRISRLFTYYATRILEGTVNEDSGASMRNAIKSVANFGCIRESLWWYNEKKFTMRLNSNQI